MSIGETTRSELGKRRFALPLVLYLAPWSFVLVAGFKLQSRLLSAEGGGYDFLAEVLGLGNASRLPASQRLALFRADAILVGVLGTIAFVALLRITAPRFRTLVAGGLSLTLFLILYAELKAWWEVGTFVSSRLLAEGIFGSGRELISEYAVSASVRRLGLAVLVLLGACAALHVLERRRAGPWLHARLKRVPAMLAAVGAATVLVFGLLRTPWTPYSRSGVLASMGAFFGQGLVPAPATDSLPRTAPELMSSYAALSGAPVPNGPSKYFGKARGYDVVFILFESLPDACFQLPEAAAALVNFKRLERNGFVALAHYATYPYSRRAYNSIYTSWYPLNGIRGVMERYGRVSRRLRAPGVVHSLAMSGYETVAFVPERPVGLEEDQLRYNAFGFGEHFVPTSAYDKPEGVRLDDSHRDWVRVRDRETFDSLKARARAAIAADRRYFFTFNPQVSHGPWPDLTSESSRDETCRSGLRLFHEVDGMVGELTDLLRETGRLDRTLIVALGDHGLRTRREYPPFHAGTLDDVTFHVPLVLYAPGVVDSSRRIPWMTSHIDIAPSVLDLLGVTVDRELELGSPMWEPRVADRATYFFAKGYLGADGYQRRRTALMVRYLYGGVSRAPWNGTLRFMASDLLNASDSGSRQVVERLNRIAALQAQLGRTMLPDGWAAAHPGTPHHIATGSLMAPTGATPDSGERR